MADYYTSTSTSTRASVPSSAWIDITRSKASRTSGALSGLGVTPDITGGLNIWSLVVTVIVGAAAHMVGAVSTLYMLERFGKNKK